MNRILLAGLLLPVFAVAQDGIPDLSFGTDGYFPFTVGNYDDVQQECVVQPDDKILIAAKNSMAHVIRLMPDGGKDTTFGIGGQADINFCWTSDWITDMELLPDGKILCAGFESYGTQVPYPNVVTFRLSAEGEIDTTYGDSAFMTYHHLGVESQYPEIAVAADGSIIGIARTHDGISAGNYLFKLESDGSIDTTFGGGTGYILFSAAANFGGADIHVQPDGKFVIAGGNSTSAFGAARYLPDGTPDATFGVNGKVLLTIPGTAAGVREMILHTDGRITLCGSTTTHVTLAQLLPDGSLNSSFGTGGIAQFSYTYSLAGRDFIELSDGRLVVCNGEGEYGVTCLTPTGQILNSFGTAGSASNWAAGNDAVRHLALQSNDRIIAIGYADHQVWWHTGWDTGVGRYLTSPFVTGVEAVSQVPAQAWYADGWVMLVDPSGDHVLDLFSAQGQHLSVRSSGSEQTRAWVGELAPGVYALSIDGRQGVKLVVL